jgi:hypothetical protein
LRAGWRPVRAGGPEGAAAAATDPIVETRSSALWRSAASAELGFAVPLGKT